MPRVIRNNVNICKPDTCPIPVPADAAEALSRVPDINGSERSADATITVCKSVLEWSTFDEIEWDDASVIDICGMSG